ncbi:D-dopachrome tautomerase-like [Tropilaelaps mercedesae]|uniref:D-dopachrome decarboxylase n=1 Tax=Tropilaelaps mercedesae TaxID=418985 RepID=A0A1V9XNL5_9ACAR|nr:D-dopachrome tautomerase-like [Tropilaelaps mercedesae]
MPLCVLRTNLKRSSFQPDFHAIFTKYVADVLQKPTEKITLVVQTEADMSRGGSNSATVWLSIESINVFSNEKNPEIGGNLRQHLKSLLNIPENRIVVTLRDLPKADVV